MRRLYPVTSPEAPVERLYEDLILDAGTTRAHVALGMVVSLDGAVTVDGVSGDLGGDADQVAFRRLRDAADAILVGAGTVRAEDYGPPRATEARRRARLERGLGETPRLVIVSGSLSLAPDLRVFSDPSARPIVVTAAGADAHRRRVLDPVAEVLVAGDREVDLAAAIDALTERGLVRVACEGGPSLNGALLAADLVDEIFVTVAPVAVAGDGPRLARGPQPLDSRRFALAEVHEHTGELLLRYRRIRHPDASRVGG
jgi:riboflavin-specific deaminase-like protein